MSNISNLYLGIMGSRKCRYSQFLLPNYSLIFENRRLSTHGGLIMYIHDDFAYKDLNQEIIISGTSTLFKSLLLKYSEKCANFRNM